MHDWEEEEKLWEDDEIVRQLEREQRLILEVGRLVRTVHTVLTLWCDRQFEALAALTQGRALAAEQLEALWQETRQIMQGKPVVLRLEMLLESMDVSLDTPPPSIVWLVSLVLWKETNFWPFVEDTPGRLYLLLRDSITELYDVSIVKGNDYFKRKYG